MSLPSSLRASLHTLPEITPGEQAVLFKLLMRSDVEQYLVRQYQEFLKKQKLQDTPESQASFQQSRIFRGLVDKLMESLHEEVGDEHTEKRLKLMAMLHEIERSKRAEQKPIARGIDWLQTLFRRSNFFAEHVAKDDGFTVRYEQILTQHTDIISEKIGKQCGKVIGEAAADVEKAATIAARTPSMPEYSPQLPRLKEAEQTLGKGPEIG